MVDLNGFGITGTTAMLLTFFVLGVIELCKAVYDREWRKAIIIAAAGIAGLAVAPMLGLNIITGICGGLGASGVVTLMQNVGKNK